MGVEQLQIAKSGSASEFYRNAVLLQQGAEILQGKNYPIVAVARDNLNEAVRFKNNRLFYPAHDEMARALISYMSLGQKMELLKQYTQTPAHQIPSTIRELKDELRMEVQIRQQQLQQRQQPTQQTQRIQQRSLDGELDL